MIKITKKKNKAWVTFTYKPTQKVSSVILSGSWNDWAGESMKEKKNGEFYITKVLECGKNYECRYFVNEKEWYNESQLPVVDNPHGSHNSLLAL